LDEEAIQSVLRRYGLADPHVVRRAGGTAGSSVVVDAGGKRYSLRARSEEHADPDTIAFEHDLVRTLDDAGFPVAAPLAACDGKTWVEACSRIIEVTPWIEGDAFEPGNAEQLRELGRQVAVFHGITSRVQVRKEKRREDDPRRLIEDLAAFLADVDASGHEDLLSEVRALLWQLDEKLHGTIYGQLPEAIIHGDLHPGNVKFKGNRLAGFFDFDWANRQERVRDVGDALLFFAGRRGPADADDIWSLTQAVVVDERLAATVLASYEDVSALTPNEKRALPDVMAARWMQVRIRGMRKVPPERRIRFLDRDDLLAVADHIGRFRAPC